MAPSTSSHFAARPSRIALACALLLSTAAASAQTASAAPTETITITGRALETASVAGFGNTPLARTPLQAAGFGALQLQDAGIGAISGLTRLDAGVSDAYNAEGYWSNLSVRGYTLDSRFNYRRDGLPINAETAIALENKERLELLKGTSGIQAGTSAPGGLVNLVVKRPNGTVRTARLEARDTGSVLGAADLGGRFGSDDRFALRLNLAAERLSAPQRHTKGERWMAALAGDWRLAPDTLLQAEVEASHQSQPSVAGFSMLGDRVPSASSIDLRLNLNDQPWAQPVVMDGQTASLRLQQRLSAEWTFTAHAMQQRLKSDDRTAFPYGVYDPVTYDCPQWCDRFAPDGTFTYWQYVSDHERRTSSALQFSLAGQARTGPVAHQLETGVLFTRYRGRFQDQIFDIAGTGRIDGSLTTPPSPGFPDANTNRSERSTELFVRDAMQLAPAWQLWAGLRHTRIDRAAERTSVDGDGGLRATHYDRQATTPWLALAWEFLPRTMLYTSWGKGLEADVAPNRSRYRNAGQSLEINSRQWEAGLKHGTDRVEAALTWFDIDRGYPDDLGECSGTPGSCLRAIDGSARHRGIEAQGTLQLMPGWQLQASAMWLDAQRRGSQRPDVNGRRPVNVPSRSLRIGTEWRPAALAHLALLANVTAEGDREVLPYGQSVRIGGWARLDLAARFKQVLSDQTTLTWRLGVDNATDRRAWKEAPYEFSHVYLYPLQPRTWRGSVQLAF